MEIIEIYFIFAITTGITSCYEFIAPAVSKAKKAGVINSFTQSTWLSYFIYTVITTLFTPFTILPIFIPSFNERFRIGIEKVVMESQP